MRTRIAFVVLVSMLLPAASGAQIRIPLPRIGGRGPAPAQLPPQPGPIAQELAYRRSHLSVESYPIVSFINSPSMVSGAMTSWTTFGMGARADYRFNRFVSGTIDMTSSFQGGPALFQTAEVGARFHRERTESKWYPYVDVRLGYMSAYASGLGQFGNVFIDPSVPYYGTQYSRGFGAIAGVGTEYALTRMFSLTTGFSVVRGRMTTHQFNSPEFNDRTFPMTAVRYTLGLVFNPVRTIHAFKNDPTAR